MNTVCLYFQVHQPFRLKRYRFFDIGKEHYYYDDYTNENILCKVANNCYLPTNKLLLQAINKSAGKFKVAFSISGMALQQFEMYMPEVLESFKALANTGCVEFLCETEAHSLAALKSNEEFTQQVLAHRDKIKQHFGVTPTVFRNTELIYSDQIGDLIQKLGFKTMLTEGAKHILGWKSPNYLYCNALNPRLKLLLRNFKLSDDLSFRFSNSSWSEYPLTAEKYCSWLKKLPQEDEVVNLFLDYETFGEHQPKSSGIFEFLKHFAQVAIAEGIQFETPSEIAQRLQPIAAISVSHPISWADEERDLSAWLGNELQDEAFNKLYALKPYIDQIEDEKLKKDWLMLQASDHFYYMSTKFFSDGEVHAYFNPYQSPYDAFMNYMNVLSDFSAQVKAKAPQSDEKESKIFRLTTELDEKEAQIKLLKKKLSELEPIKKPVNKKIKP